ncbi:hypothetical protein RJ40_05800 [Methanofollis aquaemaris]|uniref:Uncharacterized protein n=1 Tax=Methanofollis aquaemaris TaxID=126734 RepID=A0A8A3S541_9EURY|nr:hypothetical protein [Methanofollis aquaemaris]QSZ67043.1 hypothetical protein RJ40_05800 [Methanofollis aquaemaris]
MNPPHIMDQEHKAIAHSPRSTSPDHGDPGPEEAATSRIWGEAGFLPPPVCREAVELLHLLAMEDETAEGDGIAFIIGMAMQALRLSRSRFHILNIHKIEEIAIEYGVAVAGRDPDAIARDVTEMIIADYGRRPSTLMETP